MGNNSPDRELSVQQARFVDYYLENPDNQTEAARRAGYSLHTAKEQACRLMNNPRVVSEIEKKGGDIARELGITQEKILRELMLIAFANPSDIIEISEKTGEVFLRQLTKEQAAATEITYQRTGNKSGSVTIKAIKPAEKVAALEKLGKHIGMFTDKLEVSGNLSLASLVEQSFKVIDQPEILQIEDKSDQQDNGRPD